jgi:hypothetical protein
MSDVTRMLWLSGPLAPYNSADQVLCASKGEDSWQIVTDEKVETCCFYRTLRLFGKPRSSAGPQAGFCGSRHQHSHGDELKKYYVIQNMTAIIGAGISHEGRQRRARTTDRAMLLPIPGTYPMSVLCVDCLPWAPWGGRGGLLRSGVTTGPRDENTIISQTIGPRSRLRL